MATTSGVWVERSGPAIRAALVEHAPGEAARFEADLRAALSAAAMDLDLARVDAVLDRWHALAVMTANPLTPSEAAQLARARTGGIPAVGITALVLTGGSSARTAISEASSNERRPRPGALERQNEDLLEPAG